MSECPRLLPLHAIYDCFVLLCLGEVFALLSGYLTLGRATTTTIAIMMKTTTGLHSRRLVEMMHYGTIPVIIADGYIPPLAPHLNW